MGFNFLNNIPGVKIFSQEMTAAELSTNAVALNIPTGKYVFIESYAILTGGTVAFDLGTPRIDGLTSGFSFLTSGVISPAAGLDALYFFLPRNPGIYTPQAPEDYVLNLVYAAGDGILTLYTLAVEY